MKQEGTNLQSLEDRLNNPKSKLSTGDQSRLGEQILESKEKLNGYASQLDELEMGKQNSKDKKIPIIWKNLRSLYIFFILTFQI